MLNEISQFIENGKREILESLLQAVLDAAKNDDAIIFNDSEANQRKLYGIIGTVIPDVFRGSLTFATHYVERYAPEEVTAKPVKIRSMFPDIINKAFKYEEAISAGKKAFWFEKNIYSRIAPGRYVKDIIESVLNGNSKFDILTKVQTISRIIDKTGCDADTAISIYYLTKKNLEWFESADEFNKAFTLAAAYKYINEAEIAKQLYDEVLSVGKWGIRSTILPQLKFIYPYCDIGTKGNIISDYINNIYEYGARDGKELSCLVEYIKREAPFSWEDFARFLLLDPSWEKYINNVHSGAEEYLVFSGLCTAMYVNKDDRNALAKGYSLTKIIFTQAINKRNIEDIKQYWSLITTFGRQNESWFLKNCASRYFETALTDEDSLRYALSLLMLMSNGTEKESMLYSFLHKNVNNAGMLSTYIEFAGKNKAFFAEFEHKYARDSVIADFLFKKSGYEFMNSSVVTFDLLKNYYETYFRRGYDKGTFKIKVMEYVKSCKDEKSRFDACINIAQGPYRSLIPDIVPPAQHAHANSYISLAIGLGSVIAMAVAPTLKFVFNYQMSISAQFIMAGLAFALAMIWTCLTIKEKSSLNSAEADVNTKEEIQKQSFWDSLKDFFLLSPEVKKICTMQFFTWIGMMCLLIYFTAFAIHTVYGIPDDTTIEIEQALKDTAQNYALIGLAIFNLICFLIAVPIGTLAHKFGNKKVHIISLSSMILAYLGLALFCHNSIAVLCFMALSGIGWASVSALPFAMLSKYIKPGTEGSVMGIFNIFIAGPQVFVCTLVGWIINMAAINGGINHHYEYSFYIGAVCLLLAVLATFSIKE